MSNLRKFFFYILYENSIFTKIHFLKNEIANAMKINLFTPAVRLLSIFTSLFILDHKKLKKNVGKS